MQTRKDNLLWQTVIDRPRQNLWTFSEFLALNFSRTDLKMVKRAKHI